LLRKRFATSRKTWQIINIWSPLDTVVDSAFQKYPEARQFSKLQLVENLRGGLVLIKNILL